MNVEHIERSIENAINNKSKVIPEILRLDGMSGNMVRHFLNNVANFDGVNYLEIGSWKGSTILSASCYNTGKFTAIDNFSEFGGPKQELLANKNIFNLYCNFDFIEGSCWEIDQSLIPEYINVYFFDGSHDYYSQKRAFTEFQGVFTSRFIAVIDDFNDKSGMVQKGTKDGIVESNLEILYEKVVGADRESDRQGWWNGLGIYLLEKK